MKKEWYLFLSVILAAGVWWLASGWIRPTLALLRPAVAEAAAGPAQAAIDPEWRVKEQRRMQALSELLQRALSMPEGRNLPCVIAESEAAWLLFKSVTSAGAGAGADALGRNGELVDSFGHPLRFHRRASDSLDIHSAGPDGRFYTADDMQLDGPPGKAEWVLGGGIATK